MWRRRTMMRNGAKNNTPARSLETWRRKKNNKHAGTMIFLEKEINIKKKKKALFFKTAIPFAFVFLVHFLQLYSITMLDILFSTCSLRCSSYFTPFLFSPLFLSDWVILFFPILFTFSLFARFLRSFVPSFVFHVIKIYIYAREEIHRINL